MVKAIPAVVGALAAVPTIAAGSPIASVHASEGQISIAALTEIADISGLAASPDGRWIAFRIERPSISRDAIETHWYIAAADGRSPPRVVGSGGAASWSSAGVIEPGRAIWMPDSRHFIVRRLAGGRTAIWSMPVEGTAAALFEADGEIGRFALTPGGKIVAEIGPPPAAVDAAESDARDRAVLMDARVNLAEGLLKSAGSVGGARTERWTGNWFESAPFLQDITRRVIVIDPGTGANEPASTGERLLLSAPLPDPPAPAAAKNAALAVARCDADAAPCETLRLASALPLGNGRWVLTTMDANLAQNIHLWDGARRRLRLVRAAPGLLNGGRDERAPCAAAGAALFCVEAAANQPPRLVRIPLDGGTPRVLMAPNSKLAGDGLVAEPLAWRVGGSRASGWLLRPKIPGRLPLFVTYYRCAGYLRGGVGDEWPLRPMAAAGIAVLCINARPFSDERPETRYNAGLATIRAAIDLLDERGLVDRRRVGMGGLSFGSEVTMWVAAHSDLLKAASIASAQIEPAYYWLNIVADRGRFGENFRRYWGLGPPDDNPERWARLSPAAKVGTIEAPILLQIPEKEARLSPELHARLIDARRGELHIFPLAPHIKVAPRQKLAAYTRNLDWFRYWLQGRVDPDPAKAAQYARWAALAPPGGRVDSTERSQRSRSAISSNRK